jgi:hypothetical protein
MSNAHDEPTLDDVMDTEEHPRLRHREHAKAAPHPDDDELERRTELERAEVGLDPREESGATAEDSD